MQPAQSRACSWDETSYDSSSRSLPDFLNPFATHGPSSSRLTGAHADGLPEVCRLSSACSDSILRPGPELCLAMLSLLQFQGTLAPRHEWAHDPHSFNVIGRQHCRAVACQGRHAGKSRPSCHAVRHDIKAPGMQLCWVSLSPVPWTTKAVVLPAAGSHINPGRPHAAPCAARAVPPDGRPCLRCEHPGLWAPVLEPSSAAAFSREAHSGAACRST